MIGESKITFFKNSGFVCSKNRFRKETDKSDYEVVWRTEKERRKVFNIYLWT